MIGIAFFLSYLRPWNASPACVRVYVYNIGARGINRKISGLVARAIAPKHHNIIISVHGVLLLQSRRIPRNAYEQYSHNH